MATAHEIRYAFEFPDGSTTEIVLASEPREPGEGPYPSWTALGFHQCEICPLRAETHEYCPFAVSLVELVEISRAFVSHDQVRVTVTTPERVVTQDTTAQRAVASLMGLITPLSGCPKMAVFRPMARFHLPLATPDETAYRAVGMYLTGQYFRDMEGAAGSFDLKGLRDIYKEIQAVNHAIAQRLRAAAGRDTAMNALIILDIRAQMLPRMLDRALEGLRPLFEAHLD